MLSVASPVRIRSLLQLLVLTAQHRDEIAGMAWLEWALAERTSTIPREKAKNNSAHEVQLCPTAVAILKSLPHSGDAGLIFTTTGDTPVSGFSRVKQRLDEAMLVAKTQKAGQGEGQRDPTVDAARS